MSSCFVLLAGIASTVGNQAFAQDAAASCAPVVGRVVSLQGNVEVERAGTAHWLKVSRLDTSICAGDRLRTAALSRAALFVQPETLVRVDENTTISLTRTTTEVLVEFHTDEVSQSAQNAQSCGAGYFITRFPRKFKVSTPHMNAAVEGTEFMVESSCDATSLTVLEGEVLSESVGTRDTRMVTAGQSFKSGATSPGAITSVVKPQDAVQWVLRYSPLSDVQGASHAEELLRAGSVDDALTAIDAALVVDSSNSDALALRAIIQIAKNDEAVALDSARRATTANDGNYRAWLAMSYAQQAALDLEAALESASRAVALQPGSSLAHARVAELYLSLGDLRRAEEAAQTALANNPGESDAHSMLGFVHLAQIDTKAAQADFEAAIERDSFSSLPRLGLGLAMIRDGELVRGREQLEIAVALDPGSAILRSYVGKAYYEENTTAREELASTQFDLARLLDPNDPTPWFYDSILRDSQSRPAEALKSLERSAELNDDRAVYRSRQLLDLDLAARNASQASVFNELGFHQVGLQVASRSLAIDPANGSAHRFLADMHATLPRHEIARASELLQAQLRQPLGAPPLQPQLANDILFKNTFFGPATVGLNEFNPLFTQEGRDFQLFGVLGSNDAWGEQAILSGLGGPFSFSLSQIAADTDGYRANNDDSLREYDGIFQWQANADTSIQMEITDSTRDSGDLRSRFDPGFFSDVNRVEIDVDTQRLGLRQVFSPHSDLVLSIIRQDRHSSLIAPDPVFPLTLINEDESRKAEVQWIAGRERHDFIVGGSYFEADSREVLVLPGFSFDIPSTPSHVNAYGYWYFVAPDNMPQIQLGVSYDDFSSTVGGQSEINPKFGVTWRISDAVTLRATAFRVLTRAINSDQGLEPTQIAGFNQFFDDQNGTVSESGGLAADIRISTAVSMGLEVSRRDLEVPLTDADTGDVFFSSRRDDTAGGYLYWLPSDRISVSLEPRWHDIDQGVAFDNMELAEIPLSIKFISPSGLSMGLSVTGVEQSGAFDGPVGVEPSSDRFWLVDAIVAYRLPRRRGTISLEGTNLFNEEFSFQEIDEEILPRYIPEARFMLRASFSF